MFRIADPRVLARQIEHTAHLPAGSAERFSGYAVLGVGFDSGHILAMRRFPQNSLGPAYTSIWHYAPDAGWTIFADVEPALSCSRYFGRVATAAVLTTISLTWTGPSTLVVSMEHPTLEWMLQLSSTVATRVYNRVSRLSPERVRACRVVLTATSRAAERTLGTGKVALQGLVPNGQAFTAVPRMLWTVDHGAAVLQRQDLGRVRRLAEQIRLADFWIPKRGLFALAQSYLEPFDAARHTVAPAVAIASPAKTRLSTQPRTRQT
jgi:hypothetical protein